jgi:hypothetical protein
MWKLAFYRGMGSVAEQQTFLNIAHIYSINKGAIEKNHNRTQAKKPEKLDISVV